jgi:hypothetical protein
MLRCVDKGKMISDEVISSGQGNLRCGSEIHCNEWSVSRGYMIEYWNLCEFYSLALTLRAPTVKTLERVLLKERKRTQECSRSKAWLVARKHTFLIQVLISGITYIVGKSVSRDTWISHLNWHLRQIYKMFAVWRSCPYTTHFFVLQWVQRDVSFCMLWTSCCQPELLYWKE